MKHPVVGFAVRQALRMSDAERLVILQAQIEELKEELKKAQDEVSVMRNVRWNSLRVLYGWSVWTLIGWTPPWTKVAKVARIITNLDEGEYARVKEVEAEPSNFEAPVTA